MIDVLVVPLTVPVNCFVWPELPEALVGEMETLTVGEVVLVVPTVKFNELLETAPVESHALTVRLWVPVATDRFVSREPVL
jgi:hypothetical protein